MMTTRARLAAVWFSLAVVAGELLALEPATTGATAKRFDIPASVASESLKRFSEQAGVEVAFGTAATGQIMTNAMRGEYVPREALTLLLAGTDLVAIEKTGAFVIVRNSSAPKETAPAPAPPSRTVEKEKEEVVVLSPFTVVSDRDIGYAAQETLAGTRLRTSLRDVGAPMTVITRELMEDLGATGVQDALIFTPSVDTYVAGVGAGQTGESYRYESGRPFSVRGFVQSNSAFSDFFTVLASPDSYNQERLTLSRGPNSILFGVGAAGGAAVVSTKRALFGREVRTVQMAGDNYGSWRGSLDINQPLADGRAAVRVNALDERKHSFRDNEGRLQDRYTIGLAVKPTKSTVVAANFESYRTGSNYVPLQWVFDGGVLRWKDGGSPTVQSPVTRQLTVAEKAAIDPNGVLVQNTNHALIYVTGLGLTAPVVNYRWELAPDLDRFSALNGVRAQVFDPQAFYGIPRTLNPAFGTFDDPAFQAKGKWGQLFIEQQLWKGAYLEVAGSRSLESTSVVPASSSTVSIDTDMFLPDGSANPGFNLPYLNTGSLGPVVVSNHRMANQGRATLSAELDLTRFNRWLGKHQFAVHGQLGRRENYTDNKYITNLLSPNQNGFGIPTAANNRIGFRQYLTADGFTHSIGPRELLKIIDQVNQQAAAVGATTAERVAIKAALRSADPPSAYYEKAQSLSMAWQGRWLKERLVTICGVRRDAVDAFVPSSFPFGSDGYYPEANSVAFPQTPTFRDSGYTRSTGAVLHILPWLDLTANKSNNFNPSGRTNTNFDGGLLGPQHGKTQDIGVRLFLFDEKFVLGVNRFKSEGTGVPFFANTLAVPITNIITRLRNNYRNRGDSHFADLPDRILTEASLPLWTSGASDAKGYEVSLTFNPSPQWRILVTGSSNENFNGARGEDIRRFYYTNPTKYTGIDTYKAFAAELAKVAAGQPSAQFDLNPASPTAVAQATADATFINTQIKTAETNFANLQAVVGTVTSVNGKYAANGVITHLFSPKGPLKGWSAGGNFRFRSAPVVGYQPVLNALGVPSGVNDVGHPIWGSSYWEIGTMLSYERRISRKFRLKVQLNVDNPFNWQSPRLVSVGTDTDGVYGANHAIVPLRWEMRVPRTTRLTTTIWF